MRIIQLHHDERLHYSSIKDLPEIPQAVLDSEKNTPLVTFRSSGNLKPSIIRKKINACSRFLDLSSSDIMFYGLESDSTLAPLILWDVAHSLPIGSSITLIEDLRESSYLERSYYQNSLQVEYRDNKQIRLRKVAPLLAELDAGLNRWSFCIPTGPGDATGLNVVVKRILELPIPEKEIILCGRPDKDFHYWDHVRIVGEDIPAPPIWITRKKNVLAEAARYENLCILHDRVFLPKNFMEVIKRFGDYFPFVGFQSLWFDDKLNLIPARYSDYCCVTEDHFSSIATLDKNGKAILYHRTLFPEIEKNQQLGYANPLRYQAGHYLTGSLYISKKQVWLHTPQNEQLYWNDFEDNEVGKRASDNGIPHRIIPGAFTQSLYARLPFFPAGYIYYRTASGQFKHVRIIFPFLNFYQKPLIKLSEQEAQLRLVRFVKKYHAGPISKFISANKPINKICTAIYLAKLPFRKTDIMTFIEDVERDILYDQIGTMGKQWLLEQFIEHRGKAKINFTRHFHHLFLQLSLRPKGKLFYQSILDFFPQRSRWIKLGSWISALRLNKMNGDFLYHPDGLRGYYQAILDSTPFLDYTENNSDFSSHQ